MSITCIICFWRVGLFLGPVLGLQPWACKSAGDAGDAGDVVGSCLPHGVLLQLKHWKTRENEGLLLQKTEENV